MIEGHKTCLQALSRLTVPNGERCVPFLPIQNETKFDRQTVRRYIRALARKEYAEYFRGLSDEDGGFQGAGYCITSKGLMVLQSISEGRIK